MSVTFPLPAALNHSPTASLTTGGGGKAQRSFIACPKIQVKSYGESLLICGGGMLVCVSLKGRGFAFHPLAAVLAPFCSG